MRKSPDQKPDSVVKSIRIPLSLMDRIHRYRFAAYFRTELAAITRLIELGLEVEAEETDPRYRVPGAPSFAEPRSRRVA